jgi:mRNA-degrading endonuclease RelE of RelBE toxin-antitoxin system
VFLFSGFVGHRVIRPERLQLTMADDKQGRDDQAHDEANRQRVREMEEARERGDEPEPEPVVDSEALSALEPEIRERIKNARREVDPDRDLSPLSGEDAYKLRVGDYRVITDWDRDDDAVYVLTPGHRRNIYDREW